MMSNKMEQLKKAYEDIEIPVELAAITDAAIHRGKLEQKRKKQTRTIRWVKRAGACAAGVLILFVVSINTMPAFASILEKIPVLSTLVHTLQFNKGSAGGGAVTDSTNINLISLQKNGDVEQITIHFEQNDQVQQIVNSFGVTYSEYPNTMSFSIGGVRRFSAERDLAALQESGLIEAAYQVMSLDDSSIRFNITFNKNVIYEVKEYKEPAKVVLTLKPAATETNGLSFYSVRTASSPYGEEQGYYEEKWFELPGVRTLKDRQGTFFVEAGYYNNEAEALAKLKRLKDEHNFTDQTLFVERRAPLQIPDVITPN